MFFSGRSPRWQALRKTGLVVLTAGAVLLGNVQAPALARGSAASVAKTVDGTVLLSQLPSQARETYRLILAGGPFGSSRDGVVFANREHSLPGEPRGFYHEYTVPTPFAHDRGARRVVCGGLPLTRPQACYYTADHYASFRRIAP